MLGVIILAALIKLNLECKSPWVAAGLYTGASFFLGLMFGHPFFALLVGAAIHLTLSFLYFWLLKKTEGSSAWWSVMIIGLVLFFGLGFL